MNSLSKRRVVHAIPLAIVIFIVSIQSIQSMRANTWYFNALNIIKQPQEMITAQELDLANNAITYASEIEPLQAHYWHLKAYITMLNLSENYVDSDSTETIYDQVELALQSSLKHRQFWAETWIELAKVVSYKEGPSERVFEYIQHAKSVGPYKFEVLLGIIQIALMNWQQLPPNFKVQYINELKLASEYDYKFYDVFDVAEQVAAMPLLCLSLRFGREFENVRSSHTFKRHCK